MTCSRIYRNFTAEGEIRDFKGCSELRKHYASLDAKQTNPRYIEQIRERLEACEVCNEPRKELIKQYCPEKLEPGYKSPWLTDKH